MIISDNCLRVKKLHPDAKLPCYATAGSVGLDLYSLEDVILHPDVIRRVKTGIAIELPAGHEGQVRARSSLAAQGIVIPNAPGTIDTDYRGEIIVLMTKLRVADGAAESWPYATERYFFKAGDRIAQLVIAPILRVFVLDLDNLSETQRGEGGFGSTGR